MTTLLCVCSCHHPRRLKAQELVTGVPIADRIHAATACRGCAEDHVVPFRRGGDDPVPAAEVVAPPPPFTDGAPTCDRCGTAKRYYGSPGGYYLACPVCPHGEPAPPSDATGAGDEGPQ